MKAALYARVSTHDQQTLPMQLKAMREYAKRRKWKVVIEAKEVGSGAKTRPMREELLKAVRRREVDAIVVWRLDRWGRSLADLVVSLRELNELGIGFVSLTESLDLTTAQGRMMAGVLSAFAEFEREIITERVKAGIAHARSQGKRHGRPSTAAKHAAEVKKLYNRGKGLSKKEISRKLGIPRTTVIRLLDGQ
jgi:putative DNA-invertase from lambdoid prophage Rac